MGKPKIPTIAGFYLSDGTKCDFADSLQVTSNYYKLQHDLYYRTLDGRLFCVKKNFVHDGASKAFLKNFGSYTNAAILHDALYVSRRVSRYEADNLFLEAMQVCGVSYTRRYTYYWAVRAFGGMAYDSYSKAVLKKAKNYLIEIKEM